MKKTIILLIITSLLLIIGCTPPIGIVSGDSMEPTVSNGDLLFIDSRAETFERGDIIVFEAQYDCECLTHFKRVIAVAGDAIYIDIVEGNVYLNGEILDEPYIMEPMRTSGSFMRSGEFSRENPFVVEDGYVFVMGDNRNNSNDSRGNGPVSLERIRGRVTIR